LSFTNDDSVCVEFLQRWPSERLRTMTLPEYAAAGGKDTLVYSMESRLEDYGSIWGGSAFKFGILQILSEALFAQAPLHQLLTPPPSCSDADVEPIPRVLL